MLVSKVCPPQCFLSDCALPTAWPGRPPGPECALQSESLCLSEFSHRPPSFVAREGAGETGSSRGSVPCSAPGPGALLANVFIAPSELSAAAEVIVISPSAAWPWLWSLVLPSTVYRVYPICKFDICLACGTGWGRGVPILDSAMAMEAPFIWWIKGES